MTVKKNHIVFNKTKKLISQKINDEFILVPITENVVDMRSIFKLNKTGSYIWEKIDGKNSIAEIISSFALKYNIKPQKAKTDVEKFICKLSAHIIQIN
ncbi:PqqD family protein [Bacteroidota bacterium]